MILSIGYMMHVCCDVIFVTALLINSIRKYSIRKRILRICAVLKQEHNLLISTKIIRIKQYILKVYIVYFMFRRCTKKATSLVASYVCTPLLSL